MQLDAYIRVSRVAGRTGESFISPAEQLRKIEDWARANDAEILAVYEEFDRSGAKMRRPELGKILRRIKNGETQGLIVAERSRFARTVLGALQVMQDITDAGGVFVSADGFNTDSPADKLVMQNLLSLAEFELERVRGNWKAATERAIGDGAYISARPPIGYVRNGKRAALEIDPSTAPQVKKAFKMRAAGRSWREVAECLGMGRSGAVGVITNRAYLGEARGAGGIVNAAAHKPLIDVDTWEAAQPNELSRPRSGTKSDHALLKGLVKCAGCGSAMVVVGRPNMGPEGTSYFCGNQHAVRKCEAAAAIMVPRLDEYVNDQLGAALMRGDDSVWAILHGERHVSEAEAALTEAQARLDAFIEVADVVELGREGWDRGLRARKDAVANARRTLRDAKRNAAESERKHPAFADEWTSDDVRTELRRFIERVEVAKADPKRRRWQPIEERVRIVWRGSGAEAAAPRS